MCFITIVNPFLALWTWLRILPFTWPRIGLTAGVTGRQGMLTPPEACFMTIWQQFNSAYYFPFYIDMKMVSMFLMQIYKDIIMLTFSNKIIHLTKFYHQLMILVIVKGCLVKQAPGSIFTKLRRRKHKRKAFVCFKIDKVTLEQSALRYSSGDVRIISDVFELLVSTIPHINVYSVWIYV
jgi:hypothetical protein